jgi:hypothetical protein
MKINMTELSNLRIIDKNTDIDLLQKVEGLLLLTQVIYILR